jgi:hypothetical protein
MNKIKKNVPSSKIIEKRFLLALDLIEKEKDI